MLSLFGGSNQTCKDFSLADSSTECSRNLAHFYRATQHIFKWTTFLGHTGVGWPVRASTRSYTFALHIHVRWMLASTAQNYLYTVCPGSSDTFCIVSYYIKRVTTSLTYSNSKQTGHKIGIDRLRWRTDKQAKPRIDNLRIYIEA